MTVFTGGGLEADRRVVSLGSRLSGGKSWKRRVSIVSNARLLGFCRSVCLSGPEKDRVLVRSIWRAEVELLPWKPSFEIAHRRVVPAHELLSHLWMEDGFEPIYRRALTEAGLM